MSFHFTSGLDPIAVYAAIVATTALLICLIQWYRSGPRLSGQAIGNMKVHPDPSNRTYINLTVYNRGSRRTTVTALAVSAYRSWWATITRQRSALFAIQRPLQIDLPLSIEAGHYFTAGIPQTDDLIQRSRELRLYIELSYVDADNPLRIRVKPIRDAIEIRTSAEASASDMTRALTGSRRPYTPPASSLESARSA